MSEIAKQLEMEEQRRRNRERFPEMSRVIDEFRAVFGDVKVMYVKEGDQEAGEKRDEDWVPISEGDGYVGDRSRRKATDAAAGKERGVRSGVRR